MDILFLQIIILFIPGIIWERVDNRFGINRPSAQFDILRRAFSFGISSYILTAFLYSIISFVAPSYGSIFQFRVAALSKDNYTLDPGSVNQIAVASIIAMFCSIAWLYITNNKIPVRIMQFIRATKRFGDEDVWDFTFNSRRAEVEYIHFRDFENELTYSGWVELFSETGKTREIVLRNVVVTSLDGLQMYEIPRIYLARQMDKITIEFPYHVATTAEGKNETVGTDKP